MAYIRPLVSVYQEFANLGAMAGTADLPTCIIGPAYHIVDAEENLNNAYAGDYTENGLDNARFTNLLAGVTIEEDSCSFLFKYVKGAITTSPISAAQGMLNELTFGESNFPRNARVGDYLSLSLTTSYEAAEKLPDVFSSIVNKAVATLPTVGEPIPEFFSTVTATTTASGTVSAVTTASNTVTATNTASGTASAGGTATSVVTFSYGAIANAGSIIITLEDDTQLKSKTTNAFKTARTRDELLAALNSAFSVTTRNSDQGITFTNDSKLVGEDVEGNKLCLRITRNSYLGDKTKNIKSIDILDETVKKAILTSSPDFEITKEALGMTPIVPASTTEVLVKDAKIIEISTATYTLRLSRSLEKDFIESETVTTEISIYRELPDFTLRAVDNKTLIKVNVEGDTFTIQPGLEIDVDTEETKGKFKVIFAQVFPSYKGLRTDLGSKLYSIDDANKIEAQLGAAVSDNPLALGVSIAMANTTTSIYYIGVTSNDLNGYLAAKSILSNAIPMYALVPLTQETEILAMFKTYVEQQSAADVCRWSVVIGSCDTVTEQVKAEGTCNIKETSTGSKVLIQDKKAQFLTDGITPGLLFEINGETYPVDKVVSEDTLQFKDEFELEEETNIPYKVKAILTKDEQAEYVAGISGTWKSYRFINVFPGKCIINDELLPSYYVACAIGGMTAGLPPHQGFTFISIAGIAGVTGSWDYFSQEQLDVIAGAGTFILVQENADAAPYVRHQLTTDMSATDFAEFSSIKNFDYISYFISDGLDIYLGQYNIIPATLELIRSFINSRLADLAGDVVAKIGAPVTSYTPATVEADPEYKNGVNAYCGVVTPNALNRIVLRISKS